MKIYFKNHTSTSSWVKIVVSSWVDLPSVSAARKVTEYVLELTRVLKLYLTRKGLKHYKTNTYFGESYVYSIQYIVYFKHKQINTYLQASIQHKMPFLPERYIFGWSTEILRHPTSKRHNLFVWRVWLWISWGFTLKIWYLQKKTSFRKICDTDPVNQICAKMWTFNAEWLWS